MRRQPGRLLSCSNQPFGTSIHALEGMVGSERGETFKAVLMEIV